MILKLKQKLKSQIFTKNINFLMFFLLISFIAGNIFGLNSKFLLINSPGILFFVYPLIFELCSFILSFLKKKNSSKNLYLTLISIRRGFFLGICIEAFKVGS